MPLCLIGFHSRERCEWSEWGSGGCEKEEGGLEGRGLNVTRRTFVMFQTFASLTLCHFLAVAFTMSNKNKTTDHRIAKEVASADGGG